MAQNYDMTDLVARLRTMVAPDDAELRESLKVNGWVAELPAIADEHGVVLVGNRRTKLAKELGIEPVTKVVTFGSGDDADIARVRLATVSNIGGAAMTAKDRRRMAEHLYGLKWTMQAIAVALGVSKKTISLDLGELLPEETIKHPKTETNPKGAGWPKKPKKGAGDKNAKAREIIRDMIEAGTPVEAINVAEVERDHDLAHGTAQLAWAAEAGRVEGIKEATAPPPLDPSILSAADQVKYAALKKQLHDQYEKLKQKMLDGIPHEVSRLVSDHINNFLLPTYAEEFRQADLLRSHKMPFTNVEFLALLGALHEDSTDVKRRQDAFSMVKDREVILRSEKAPKKLGTGLPKTLAELLAMRKLKKKMKGKPPAPKHGGAIEAEGAIP